MIDGLSPYPEYRPSGVEWLGEVPAHWEVLPLKRWVKINRAVLPDSTPPAYEFQYLDIGSVGTGVLTARPQRLRFAAAPSRARRVVGDGDTIVSTVRTYLKAVYFVDRDSEDLICSTGFAVLTPRTGTVPKFISYLCQSSAFTDSVTADSVGIAYPAIAENRLGAFQFAIPPLPEQTAIVRFLEHADVPIRRAVKAKRRLIALLDEEKQAIIHRAVTRGLDPDVPLKPSGVEWLGDIPEHWDVRLNQRLFKEEVRAYDGQIKTQLSLSQRHGLVPTDTMEERTLQTSSYDNWKVVIPGDLVLNRFKAHLGVFFSATLRGIVSFHYGVFLPRIPLVTKYFELLYHTNVYRTIYAGCSNGMTVGLQNLSNQNFYNVRSIVPPVQEQAAILSFAEKVTEQLNVEIHSTKREIDLLLEFRTRLIADVVTGKLDVRGVAAGLPAATPGQATLDAFDAPAGDQEDAWPEPGAALEDGDGIGA